MQLNQIVHIKNQSSDDHGECRSPVRAPDGSKWNYSHRCTCKDFRVEVIPEGLPKHLEYITVRCLYCQILHHTRTSYILE